MIFIFFFLLRVQGAYTNHVDSHGGHLVKLSTKGEGGGSKKVLKNCRHGFCMAPYDTEK